LPDTLGTRGGGRAHLGEVVVDVEDVEVVTPLAQKVGSVCVCIKGG
jgi:hypothetical protein